MFPSARRYFALQAPKMDTFLLWQRRYVSIRNVKGRAKSGRRSRCNQHPRRFIHHTQDTKKLGWLLISLQCEGNTRPSIADRHHGVHCRAQLVCLAPGDFMFMSMLINILSVICCFKNRVRWCFRSTYCSVLCVCYSSVSSKGNIYWYKFYLYKKRLIVYGCMDPYTTPRYSPTEVLKHNCDRGGQTRVDSLML